MAESVMNMYVHDVVLRARPDGGFAVRQAGDPRPDSTAWAMIVLKSQGVDPGVLKAAGDRLLDHQLPDGRVVISKEHPDTLWPTPLAAMAWQDSETHAAALRKAVRFLLRAQGIHWKKSGNDVVGHDTSIPGWPWIDQTHSWVSPTAMSMIALTASGFGEHQRVKEGQRLLIDRQIPSGGWNYGNTSVLGKQLHPFPETTGIALNALAGRVDRQTVEPSLRYLYEQVPALRTPLSLGWSILALKAWNMAPHQTRDWIVETLERGPIYGGYDTVSLCVLLAAALASGGLETLVTPRRRKIGIS